MSFAPAHGPWCGAHTYPTRCRYCGEEVFYFSCNCGCKVFFNHLGDPWPEHRCMDYALATCGPELYAEALATRMMQEGYTRRPLQIEREYRRKVQQQSEADRRKPRETMTMTALPNAVITAVGRIREICNTINLFKKLRLEETTVSCALLGKLAGVPVGQVTIEVDELSLDNMESYTAVAPTTLLRSAQLQRGSLVEFTLRAQPILGKSPFWVVEMVDLVRDAR